MSLSPEVLRGIARACGENEYEVGPGCGVPWRNAASKEEIIVLS
jgi:hypothetical protein